MPNPFPISREDVLRGRSGKPGWYVLNIKKIEPKPGSNDPQSTTNWIHMVIESGPDPSVLGAPVVFYASEKAAGMVIPFIEGVTGKAIPDDGIVPDLDEFVGRKVKALLEYDQQYKSWKATDFAPVTGVVAK
jgi:hypothetical protein